MKCPDCCHVECECPFFPEPVTTFMGRVYSDEQVAKIKADVYAECMAAMNEEFRNSTRSIERLTERVKELEAKLAVAEDGLAKRDAHVGAHKRENIKLTAENARLREALEWYARSDNYLHTPHSWSVADEKIEGGWRPVVFDAGDRARKALATKRWKAPEEKK